MMATAETPAGSTWCLPRRIAAAGLWWFAALGTVSASSAELLMFQQRACPFCEKFNQEIAPDYSRSRAGLIAPLRHVDIFESRTGGVEGLEPAVFTPTFVVVDDQGREVGRLLGYPGRRYFYPEIQALVDRLALPQSNAAEAPARDAPE